MSEKYLLRDLHEKLIFFQSKIPPYLSVNSYSPIFSERISFVGKSQIVSPDEGLVSCKIKPHPIN